MGIIGRLIDHAVEKRISVILETRKGFNLKVPLYNPPGDASVPCKEDRLIIIKIDGTGNYAAVGVLVESQGAKPGEKIFYGRNADGDIVSKISMLEDGSVEINGQVNATGGTFTCIGTAAPTGTGCLCAISHCLVTGAPQTGETASDT